MTQKHPITPPPELVHQWADMLASHSDQAIFTMATQWGANQELEACCEWLAYHAAWSFALRAARRPKPPSLKQQALKVLESAPLNADEHALIRRALEALDD
jgi:hypothetical protein